MKHGRAQYERGCRCDVCRAGKAAHMKCYYARRKLRIQQANHVRPEDFVKENELWPTTTRSRRI